MTRVQQRCLHLYLLTVLQDLLADPQDHHPHCQLTVSPHHILRRLLMDLHCLHHLNRSLLPHLLNRPFHLQDLVHRHYLLLLAAEIVEHQPPLLVLLHHQQLLLLLGLLLTRYVIAA